MIGKTISHYRILDKLGEGGMGVVYKAEDVKLRREVAIKFLPHHIAGDSTAIDRFKVEAQAAAALNHNNIATIHAIEDADDETFIVMEYVKGMSLKDKIESGSIEMNEALDIAIQISQGLAKAHEKGIVHRDIKPSNIVVSNDGIAKILDFGLAKISKGSIVTKEGTTLGTAAYMSPEQARSESVDHRTDIWSLGVVLYEMITGKRPFKGEYEQAMIYSILNTEPEKMMNVPADIESIVYKALAKNPDERYKSADDLLKDLRKAHKEVESMISKEKTIEEKSKPSIAVLPFRDMSPQKDQDYFCEGISEEIINALTHIENLKVIARTSAFAFKDKQEDVREIGRKLDVETLLEGSIRKAGNRLRITAQLIKVSDGSHIWSDAYNRDLEDVFAIQEEISLAIVDNLKVKLLVKEKAAIVKRYTEDLEVYNLYLKGNYYWQMMTREGFDKAIECYEQALRKDPHYALAYTGLATAHWMSSYYGNEPPNEAYPRVKEYAEKALDIDDTLAEAHALLGVIYMNYDWNWKAAEQKFNQALQLNPNSTIVHLEYSYLLLFTGRRKEAIAEAKRAQMIDPLSSNLNSHAATAFFYDRQYDRAIEELQKTIAMDPTYFRAHSLLGFAYKGKSMFKEAIAEHEKAVELSGGPSHTMIYLAAVYYESGEKAKAEKIFDVVKQRSGDKYVPPFCFYLIHRVRGEHDQAFEWLERACDEHDSFLLCLRVHPFDEYRIPDEPRYTELLKKYGIGK